MSLGHWLCEATARRSSFFILMKNAKALSVQGFFPRASARMDSTSGAELPFGLTHISEARVCLTIQQPKGST